MDQTADTPKMDDDTETLREAIGERYLTYALSTIMHRALPDARDGLKPVHRRILYAMRELRLSPTGGFRKSAKISGDVMGNYHPHGDGAIYDAMARLAQDFALRYPLVDGQGNFGNIDGDNPAASRYTEARLTPLAEAMMEGLDEDAVDFRPNYDGTLTEPVVLPGAVPNLLANGSSGIAVGMATNIPPHNLRELCEACIHLAKAKNSDLVRDDTILDIVKGPDFPTGGIIIEPPEVIAEAYRTGKGGFRTRARWAIEDTGRGTWQAVVTEIPFQVPKSRLIEKLAELIQQKKIPILADVRDESTDDIRIVLEPRSKNVDPDVLMNMLYRNSDLESRFSMNLNVLIDGVTPKVCSLKEVLRAFLAHRRDVLERRARHRLQKIDTRLEVLEGFIIAFLNLDRVIDIIRYDEAPKAALMREDWSRDFVRATSEADYVTPPPGEGELSEAQVDAILNMRLRSLRKLEEMELRREYDALLAERADLEDLLDSEDRQWKEIAGQMRAVRDKFGDARRTDIEMATEIEEVPLEAMIEREPVTVVCSEMGWIRAMKGHIDLGSELKFKDGDGPRFIFHAETTDRILMLGENGRFYTLSAANLPGGRGMGEPLRLMVDLPNEAGILSLFVHRPGTKRLIASSGGDGFILVEDEVLAQTRAGKQALNVKGEVRAKVCTPVQGDLVASVGDNRKMLVFPVADLPVMARGKGVRLQKFKDGGLSDVRVFDGAEGLTWRDPAGRTRTVTELDEWRGARASSGRMAPRGFPQNNRFT